MATVRWPSPDGAVFGCESSAPERIVAAPVAPRPATPSLTAAPEPDEDDVRDVDDVVDSVDADGSNGEPAAGEGVSAIFPTRFG